MLREKSSTNFIVSVYLTVLPWRFEIKNSHYFDSRNTLNIKEVRVVSISKDGYVVDNCISSCLQIFIRLNGNRYTLHNPTYLLPLFELIVSK